MLQDIDLLKQRLDEITREAEGLQRENQLLNRKGEDLTKVFKEAESQLRHYE